MTGTFRRDLAAVLPAWVVARLLVVGSMLGVRLYVDHIHDGERPLQVGQGLLAWDGAWYRALVESGYSGVDQEGIYTHSSLRDACFSEGEGRWDRL